MSLFAPFARNSPMQHTVTDHIVPLTAVPASHSQPITSLANEPKLTPMQQVQKELAYV
jgi:hypothetical protein